MAKAEGVILIHLAFALVHGAAHVALGIGLPMPGNIFVALVIVLAPLVALGLLRGTRTTAAALVLAASMAGALAFGVWNHMIVPGADHVAHIPPGPWHRPFQVTAVLLAVTEAIGLWLGLALLAPGAASKPVA